MPKSKGCSKRTSLQLPGLTSALQESDTAPSVTDFPLTEWSFIDPARPHCPRREKPYLLEYEVAREAEALGITYRSSATWKQVFPGIFPATPYLAIDAAARAEAIKEAFSSRPGKRPMFDHTAASQGLLYTVEYALTPKWQNLLEGVVEQWRESHDISDPERELYWTMAEFRQTLSEDAYDKSVANVALTIHFEFSDKRLKQAFAELLSSIRRVDHIPGLKDELNAKLKRLAATRLYRIFGTVEKARSFAFAEGFENHLYKDDGGWSRARKEVWQWLGYKCKE
jgi:hypothetical protein